MVKKRDVQNKTKGGEKEMDYEMIHEKRPVAKCPYCDKKIVSANNSESEVENNLKVHIMYCKKNPSNKSK